MKKVNLESIRKQSFTQAFDIVLSDARLPVAIKKNLLDNFIKMEANTESILINEIDQKELLPYVSVAVILALRPILKGV